MTRFITLICASFLAKPQAAQPKILALGRGQHETAMIAVIHKSGYIGPVGILDHLNDTDTEIALKENLEILEEILT